MASDVFSIIIPERKRLAEDLADVKTDQWRGPSLCTDWTIQQVLGHIVATAKMTPPSFIGGFIGSGFRFGRFVEKRLKRESAGTPSQTLAELQAHVGDTTTPPGPKAAMIGEIVVHSMDIRKPLGISRNFPFATLQRVADFYTASNALIGAKKRIAGFELIATDGDWRHGSGAEIRGPMLSLVMTMTGRTAFLDDLSGAGVVDLRKRLAGG